jgi:coproporphyrinogen III oxidase-like Fe-S oxidoreductase
LRIKTYIGAFQSRLPITNYQFPLSPATVNQHKQTLQDDMSEFMMTGLRLTEEGVSETEFQARFDTALRDVYGKEIEELLKFGLIESQTSEVSELGVLRLTARGRLLGNSGLYAVCVSGLHKQQFVLDMQLFLLTIFGVSVTQIGR